MTPAERRLLAASASLFAEEMIAARVPLPEARDMFEDAYVAEAMAQAKGNVTRASRIAGVHRNTMHGKLRK